MSTSNTVPNQDPYAAYGGGVAGSGNDPYAKYGGQAGTAPATAAPTSTAAPSGEPTRGQKFDDAFHKYAPAMPAPFVTNDMALGGLKSGMQVVATVGDLARKAAHAVAPELTDKVLPEQSMKGFKDWTDPKGFQQNFGAISETIAEFAMGDAALKGLSLVEKVGKVTPLLKVMKKYPRVAAILASAIRQGAVSGVQGVAHGEDLKTAAEQAGTTAVMSGATDVVAPYVAKGAKKLLARVAPTTEKVGGIDVPVPAAARNAKPTEAQKAAQQVYAESARESARPALEDINAAREPELVKIAGRGEGGAAAVAGADDVSGGMAAQRARTELGSTASTVPERVMPRNPLTEEIGSQAAAVPERVLGERAGAEARSIVAERPSATPKISIDEHLNRVHDFTGAADLVEEHAKAIYDRANDASGGLFKQINDELRQAQKRAWMSRGKDAGIEAADQVKMLRAQMEELINGLKGQMRPEEINAARSAFRRGYVLREVANTLDTAWSGIPGSSNRANAYRGFDGDRLMSNLQRLVRSMGRGQVEQAIGKNRLENLERIAELNRTGANRQRFGAAVDHVAKWLNENGWRHISWPIAGGAISEMLGGGWAIGATAGEGAFFATRKVMQALATNPRLGQFLTYAIESGARPENYGPMLGAMILRMEMAHGRAEQASKNQARQEDKPQHE